ncbi:hypothetical protein H7J88_06570 [Mycolicibacterium flavescens]|uniref:Uncharacterized protein n=1 Tax=Mycolicibacterium flavescens TaxID=1776 RepID=A0A1E3RQF3_MYCFV|nr:hypothetical protein [Mycolicibacterium flavescens]MCV7279307.1 hypothetical protein [Mycolicibacterium flavescens]ODQ92071.1 hypothetical protein BHQ18_04340 [Mycolicibacterium flavescens]
MTSQTGRHRDIWRRLVFGGVGGVMAAGLLCGVAAPSALAQPSAPSTTETPAPEAQAAEPKRPCTGDDCKRQEAPTTPKINGDQVLMAIYEQYRQGDGGGQISTLIDDAMKLRRQGFRPSQLNAAALADALERRPNQTPLIEALKSTISYQRKQQAQAQASVTTNGPVAGPVPVLPGMNVPLG